VAEQFSFDSRCPKCNLLAHQQADADTLKSDLESDEFRLYCIRCDHYWIIGLRRLYIKTGEGVKACVAIHATIGPYTNGTE
jgi:hypothetical protein